MICSCPEQSELFPGPAAAAESKALDPDLLYKIATVIGWLMLWSTLWLPSMELFLDSALTALKLCLSFSGMGQRNMWKL